ncbi:hypothetical protein NL676_020790 [Syzygium grande]|nr:hypothetical protein NL676_020790 [Syzygium grande]
MFSSLSRTLLLRPLFLPTTTLRLISTTTSTSNRPSFAVSYLVNSCGLSPESALFVSERVNFETSARPDAVIDVFKNHGFSQSQISGIFRKWPRLILASPERTLLPKLKYLRSVGFSGSDLVKLITAAPYVLTRSLEKHLIPNFTKFAVAMLAVVGMSESTWERKFDAYGRWGWSRDDAMRAFVKIPWCMTLSEEKIMEVMGFFVKEMGFESSFLLRHPRRFPGEVLDPSYRGSSGIAGYISREEAHGNGNTGSMKMAQGSFFICAKFFQIEKIEESAKIILGNQSSKGLEV